MQKQIIPHPLEGESSHCEKVFFCLLVSQPTHVNWIIIAEETIDAQYCVHPNDKSCSENAFVAFSVLVERFCCKGFKNPWPIIWYLLQSHKFYHVLFRSTHKLFQISYEWDFGSLCTVTFWQKVDFLISNTH